MSYISEEKYHDGQYQYIRKYMIPEEVYLKNLDWTLLKSDCGINRSAEYGLPEPLFEEFGDGIKVTMFRKVGSSARKVSSADEKVGSTFAGRFSCSNNARRCSTTIKRDGDT